MLTDNLTIHNLASGSSANALLIRGPGLTMLVDAGLPIRKMRASLASLGVALEEIDLVFITHEHSDHIRSLPQLMRSGAMLMTSHGSGRALRLQPTDFLPAVAGKQHEVAGFSLLPLAVSHDAREPLGLCIESGGTTITVMTDLGCVDERHIEVMASSDLIVLEANHDLDMLRLGPYPAHLKRRVMSGVGHLSNAECGKALRSALARSGRSPQIWLAHLSETNNRPVTAATTVRQHIPGARLAILPRHEAIDLLGNSESTAVPAVAVQTSLWSDQ